MLTAISLFLIIAFSYLLIKSADLVVTSLKHISQQTKTGIFVLSSLLLAVGTSLPELSVGISSALNNASNLVMGVIIGSNIANIALVAGTSALIRGKVIVNEDYYKRDVVIAFVASLAPLILIIDGQINRIDGLILLAIYGSYATSFFNKEYREVARGAKGDTFFYRMFRVADNFDLKATRKYSRLFVGIALLLLSSDIIVRSSKLFASRSITKVE